MALFVVSWPVASTRWLSLVVGVLLGACGAEQPVVVDGVIDLRSWDFEREGPVELSGDWELAFARLLVDEGTPLRSTPDRLKVPGSWTGAATVEGRATNFGHGTLRARLLLPPGPMAVTLTHANSAYTLDVVDDEGVLRRLMSVGRVGKDAAHSEADAVPRRATLPPSTSPTLLLQISNHDYMQGGPAGALRLGRPGQLEQERRTATERDFFVVGVLVMIGLYHLGLFAMRRSEPAPWWLALFCFIIAARTIERGYYLPEYFSGQNIWLPIRRMIFILMNIAPAVFLLYLRDAVPGLLGRALVRAVVGWSVGLGAFCLLTPLRVFCYTTFPYQAVLIVVVVWILVLLARASKKANAWSVRCILFGAIIIAAATINDILRLQNLLHTPFLIGPGLVGFVLCQAMVLAMGAARARRSAEELSVQLAELDRLKDEFLAHTTHELRAPLDVIITIPGSLLTLMSLERVLSCGFCGEITGCDDDDDDGPVKDRACSACGALGLVVDERSVAPDDVDLLAHRLGAVVGSGEQLLVLVNNILEHSRRAAARFSLQRDVQERVKAPSAKT